jgi:hypothetical protein
MSENRNDLAFWLPKLLASGVPVPRTEIVRTEVDLTQLLDGITPAGYEAFLLELRDAADRVGYPCFLRTGHTSGKHDWRRTCYVEHPEDLASHVAALVEQSALADIMGLPTETWAIREFLRLRVRFTAFGGTPVAREFRTFFRDGECLCLHPYWPPGSIESPSCRDWRARLEDMGRLGPAQEQALRSRVRRVAREFDGAWSLDFASGKDGIFYAIDMAEMDRSFHWPGCPYGKEASHA